MSSGNFLAKIKILTGTFLGSGLLPKAPGTWGSLAFLPVIYLVSVAYGFTGLVLLLAAAILLSLWSTGENVKKFGPDPPQFVMDECAGQVIPFLGIRFTLTAGADLIYLAAGFILFRLFDITKPLGIRQLEKLGGKYGILADDLLAGVYALICLEALLLLLNTLF